LGQKPGYDIMNDGNPPPELRPIPRWISIVSLLISALGLFVAGALYLNPEAFIKDVDLSSQGTRFLANMWAARQSSLAFIVGSATIKKAAPMLHIALVAYCLMNIQDAIIGARRGDTSLVIGATFFSVLTGYMALRVRRKALMRA
jgi:hypothetical protein